MPFPKTRDELIAAGYKFSNHGVCKSCQATMEWYETPRGKKMPFNHMQEGTSLAVRAKRCTEGAGKVKITPDWEITEDRILELRERDTAESAGIYDRRVRQIDRNQKRTFVELGLIMVEMEDKQLFRLVPDPEGKPFRSLGSWISNASPVARSNAYSALNAMRAINEEVSIQDLQEMSRANVITLKGLSTEVRTRPDVIEAAKAMPEQDFKRKIQQDHPQQHIEANAPMRFQPTESDRQVIDETFEMIRWTYDLTSREDALLAVCLYFRTGMSEKEHFQHLSNQQAWESR